MKVKLYGIPGSHPVMGAQLMLDHKGIPYHRRDLFPVASRVLIRALGFKSNRVPALKIDGRRIQGTHDIARELDAIRPDPPLFPADPQQRAAVEEAEAWRDPFQQVARGIIWCLLMAFGDLRPAIEPRPAGQHAQRLLPWAPGKIPRVFPVEWLKPLRAPTPS